MVDPETNEIKLIDFGVSNPLTYVIVYLFFDIHSFLWKFGLAVPAAIFTVARTCILHRREFTTSHKRTKSTFSQQVLSVQKRYGYI